MSEGKGSNVVLWIALGGLALMGLCCAGVGGVAYYAYQQAEARQRQAVVEMQRQEDEMRRQQQEAEQAYQRELAQDQANQGMLDPPPPLSISPTPTSDRRPRHITALVTRAEGSSGVSVGDTCDYDVQVLDSPSQAAGYWCRAFVECSGVRLYGTDTPRRNGFFPCQIFASPLGVAGEDRETTGGTGDPLYQIDTRLGRMVVIDDDTSMVGGAFRVEATITSVQ